MGNGRRLGEGNRLIHLAIFSPIPALGAGLRALLSGDPEINVLLVAASLTPDISLPPELAVIIAAPGGVDASAAGLEALDAAGFAWPDLTLLLISDEAEPDELRRLNGLGLRAWGVIPPEATSEALQAAIRALVEGLTVVSNEVLQGMLAARQAEDQVLVSALGAAVQNPGEAGGPVEHLTERESDVLRLVAQGLTNKQIALALAISEHTVKFHVSSIYSKLGVSNRTEAVRKGARLGWIPL